MVVKIDFWLIDSKNVYTISSWLSDRPVLCLFCPASWKARAKIRSNVRQEKLFCILRSHICKRWLNNHGEVFFLISETNKITSCLCISTSWTRINVKPPTFNQVTKFPDIAHLQPSHPLPEKEAPLHNVYFAHGSWKPVKSKKRPKNSENLIKSKQSKQFIKCKS